MNTNADSGLTIVSTEMLTRRLLDATSASSEFKMVQAADVKINMKAYSDRDYVINHIGGYSSMMAVQVPFWANGWGTDVNPLKLRDEKHDAVVFVCKSSYHNGHSATTLSHFLHGGGWALESRLTPPAVSHDTAESAPMKCYYKQMPSGITVSIPPTNQVAVFVDIHANQDGSFAKDDAHRHVSSQCQYESRSPTYSSNRVCSALEHCLLGINHQTAAPTYNSDRVCTKNTACTVGQYQSTPPTLTTDRQCTAHTTCNYILPPQLGAGEYELKGPTLTTDRVCSDLTECLTQQYITTNATRTSDRTCNAWTVCGPTHYQTNGDVAPSLVIDRDCSHLTTCDQTSVPPQYQTVSPTTTSDRNCSSATVCYRPQVVKVPHTPLTNTICANNCSSDEFETALPAVTYLERKMGHPNICKKLRECNSTTEWEEVAATASSNRVCRILTHCNVGMFEEVSPTVTSDRTCSVYEKPIINVYGSDIVTIAATHTGFYADEGATCRDVNCKGADKICDISQQVDISGSVFPELHTPGTYGIKYNCISSTSGHHAHSATRQVVIHDSVAPVCTLRPGASKVEASFPYTDPGFTCTDSIDGALDLTGANTQVISNVNPEHTGRYLITYRAKDSSGNWNDCTGCVGGQELVRTVQVVDTLRPVIALHHGGSGLSADTFLEAGGSKGGAEDVGAGGEANPAKGYQGYSSSRRLLEQRLEETGSIKSIVWLGVGTLALALAAIFGGVLKVRKVESLEVYTTNVDV
jgi:hypothetical protein